MRVQIIKCTNPGYWYKDQIGICFDVYTYQLPSWEYVVRLDDPNDKMFLIHPEDCKVVE